jgi:hypothetical protein
MTAKDGTNRKPLSIPTTTPCARSACQCAVQREHHVPEQDAEGSAEENAPDGRCRIPSGLRRHQACRLSIQEMLDDVWVNSFPDS